MSRFRLRPDGKIQLSEKDVIQQCLDALRVRRFYPLRLQSGRFWTLDKRRIVTIGEPGIPDYVVPQFFIETKRPRDGKLEAAQKQKIWELKQFYDLPTLVVDNVEALMAWLDKNAKR